MKNVISKVASSQRPADSTASTAEPIRRRRKQLLSAAAAIATASLIALPATPASAGQKTWNYAAYNIAPATYSSHLLMTPGGLEPADQYLTNPDLSDFWAAPGTDGLRRSSMIAAPVDNDFAFPVTDKPNVDVVFIQEAMQTVQVKDESGVLGTHISRVDTRLANFSGGAEYLRSPSGDFAAYQAGHTPDTITVAGVARSRPLAASSHIYYNKATLLPLSSGTVLSQSLISSSLKPSYLQALGTSYSSLDLVNRDRIFTWSFLRSTGAGTSEPNKSMVVSSLHSNVAHNYAIDSTAIADYYNAEIVRGLSNHLRSLSLGGSPAKSPLVIGGDMNAWYRTGTVNRPLLGSATYKSPPRLLQDMGSVDWVDTRPWQQTSACPGASTANCSTYHTFQGPTSNYTPQTIDHIFSGYPIVTGQSTPVTTPRDLITLSDGVGTNNRRWSDHRFFTTQVTYP